MYGVHAISLCMYDFFFFRLLLSFELLVFDNYRVMSAKFVLIFKSFREINTGMALGVCGAILIAFQGIV